MKRLGKIKSASQVVTVLFHKLYFVLQIGSNITSTLRVDLSKKQTLENTDLGGQQKEKDKAMELLQLLNYGLRTESD